MHIAFVSQAFDKVIPPIQSSVGIWTYQVACRLAHTNRVIVYVNSEKVSDHDGAITKAEGCVPGDVRLFNEIPYLRKGFAGEGVWLFVHLEGCTFVSFRPFEQPPIDSLEGIARAEPEILYVQNIEPVVIDCTAGTLSVSYQAASVYLDTGEEVSYEQLVQACDDYWNAWKKRHDERGA